MRKDRLQAFSDGVVAILITIMVLELKPPDGATLGALRPLIPLFLAYVVSFVFLGIYWNNHLCRERSSTRRVLAWHSPLPLDGTSREGSLRCSRSP